MNVKSLVLSLLLLIGCPIWAMAPAPGTVIDPLQHTGQFTVSISDNAFASGPSALPTVSQITHAGTDLFKTKGIPVIITTAASMVPWWALTTGTGYLLISVCNISDPALLTAMAGGASYAAGEKTSSLIKKCISNPYFQSATQVAVCAACLGLSYVGSNALINDAFFASAQAISWQTLMDNSTKLLAPSQSTSNAPSSSTWISRETKEGMIEGTINALSTMVPGLCAANYCDSNALLRVLLYEQAYRLAHSGCTAAQQFIQK